MINHSQILLDPSTFLPFNALHLCKLHQLTTGKDGIAFMTSYKSPKIKCGFAFPLHSWTLREVSSDPNKASKDENKVAIKLFLLAIKHVMQWMSSPTLLCLKFLSFLCVFYYENIIICIFSDLLDPSTNLQHLQILHHRISIDSAPAGSLKTNVGTQSKSMAGLMLHCFLGLQTNRSLI